MQLLIGTQNRDKLVELNSLLDLPGLKLLSAADVAVVADLDVEETGATFSDNAEIKARAFGQKSGILTACDDSGLEVKALNGKPGVLSKRFFPGTDQEKNLALLSLLQGVVDRSAQFKTVICLYSPQTDVVQFFDGVITGKIAKTTQGEQGFGYDPVFIPDGYTQTFGQLGSEVKNVISHRARALDQLKQYLQARLMETL